VVPAQAQQKASQSADKPQRTSVLQALVSNEDENKAAEILGTWRLMQYNANRNNEDMKAKDSAVYLMTSMLFCSFTLSKTRYCSPLLSRFQLDVLIFGLM